MTDRPDIPEAAKRFVTNHLREFLKFDGPRKPEEAEPLAVALLTSAAPALRKQGAEEAEKRCKEVEVESAKMVDDTELEEGE